MGIIERLRAFQDRNAKVEKRVISGLPWMPWNSWPEGGTFATGGLAHPSQGGYTGVSEHGARAVPALYAGARLLAASAASLPIKIYTTTAAGHRQRYTGPSLFDSPDISGNTWTWVFSAVESLVIHGNSWGMITGKDSYGFPTGIEWIPDQHVYVEEAEEGHSKLGATVFVAGREVTWFGPDAEVVHLVSYPVNGKVRGLSLIQALATTFLQGQLATEFGSARLSSGNFPAGVFQNTELEIDAEQAAGIRKLFRETVRRGDSLVIGRDWSYEGVSGISPAEYQLVELMGITATQIAAALNLPAGRLSGTTSDTHYDSNIQETLQIQSALTEWLSCMEAEFSKWLPSKRTVTFDTRKALKLDPLTEAQTLAIERANGSLTADEWREMLDRPPLAGGLGSESLPQDVLVALARGTKAIPNSWKSSVTLVTPPTAPEDESEDNENGDDTNDNQ